MPADSPVEDTIRRLVDEEQAVRAVHAAHVGDPVEHVRRLRELEGQLDQCWDLLRQRRALRSAGRDPENAQARPVSQVQGYRQ